MRDPNGDLYFRLAIVASIIGGLLSGAPFMGLITSRPTTTGPRSAGGGLSRAEVRARITQTTIAVSTTWSRKAVGVLTSA